MFGFLPSVQFNDTCLCRTAVNVGTQWYSKFPFMVWSSLYLWVQIPAISFLHFSEWNVNMEGKSAQAASFAGLLGGVSTFCGHKEVLLHCVSKKCCLLGKKSK